MVEVSKGYTTVKASNLPCNIRMYVRVLRKLNGYTRIEVMFPKHGIFVISLAWCNNNLVYEHNGNTVHKCAIIDNDFVVRNGVAVNEHCCIESINCGICFHGFVPTEDISAIDSYVDKLLSTVEFTIAFNGDHSWSTYRLVSFRDYDFKYGRCCPVYSMREFTTLDDLTRGSERTHAFTNIGLVLPGKLEDHWDYVHDTFYEVELTSGSFYAFAFETE